MNKVKNLSKRLGNIDSKRILTLDSCIPFSKKYPKIPLWKIIESDVFYLKPMIENNSIELDNEAYCLYYTKLEEAVDMQYRED